MFRLLWLSVYHVQGPGKTAAGRERLPQAEEEKGQRIGTETRAAARQERKQRSQMRSGWKERAAVLGLVVMTGVCATPARGRAAQVTAPNAETATSAVTVQGTPESEDLASAAVAAPATPESEDAGQESGSAAVTESAAAVGSAAAAESVGEAVTGGSTAAAQSAATQSQEAADTATTAAEEESSELLFVMDGEQLYARLGDAWITGWYRIEGMVYYFDPEKNGAAASGWQTIDGRVYYFGEGHARVTGVQTIEGKIYVFTKESAKQEETTDQVDPLAGVRQSSRWVQVQGREYWLDADGAAAVNGWRKLWGRLWYYFDQNGQKLRGLQKIGDKIYVFAQNGVRVENRWLKVNGKEYYLGSDGAAYLSWRKVNGFEYYFGNDGVKRTGWQKLPGNLEYYFGSNGVKRTGWQTLPGNLVYYFGSNGVKRTGWQKVGKFEYYFGSNGVRRTGWQKLPGNLEYYFGSNGVKRTGWQKLPGNLEYYFGGNGVKRTGLQKVGKFWYYFGSNGVKQTGWKKLSGKWYYFSANGTALVNGVHRVGRFTYFFDGNGVRQSGWRSAGGQKYYLRPSDGVAVTGLSWISGKLYYFDGNGRLRTAKGWFAVGGKSYYSYAGGQVAVNTTIDGRKIGSNGVAAVSSLSSMDRKVRNYSSSTGWICMVDATRHRVGIYRKVNGQWTVVRGNMICSVGAHGRTKSGVSKIYSKYYYRDFGHTTRAFYCSLAGFGGYFHTWVYHYRAPNMNLKYAMDTRLGINNSGGCCRLNIENSKYIYDHVPIGSTVVVYR